jgi:hypothetical protein
LVLVSRFPHHRSSKLGLPSSSLHDDPGRVHRVKAKPLRGRFASPDTATTTKGKAAMRRTGEEQQYDDWAARHGICVGQARNPTARVSMFAQVIRSAAVATVMICKTSAVMAGPFPVEWAGR